MRLPAWLLALALLLGGTMARADEVPYTAEIVGPLDSDLRGRIESASRLLGLADEPPASLAALGRRADDDRTRIGEVLRAEGWYAGTITIAMDAERRPVPVTIAVEPGPRFTLERFDIRIATPLGQVPPQPILLDALGIEIGSPARARQVTDAQTALLQALAEQGYPLAKAAERRVVVDHAATAMRVEMGVDSGPPTRFGSVAVTGLERLDEDWVRNRIPWREGEPFAVDQLEKLRQRLVASGLFTTVKISTAEQVGEGNLLPMTIALQERDRRSVGLGASWSSAEGVGANAFWEHRSLFDSAERLRLSLVASEIRNAVDADYRDPDLGLPDQDLLVSARIEEQRTRAFVTDTAALQSGLEWLLSPTWKASAAGAVERTIEKEQARTRRFFLVSLPLEARRDTSDDILDPSRGNRLVAGVRPFVEQLGSDIGFTRIEAYDSQYLQVFDQPRVILAGWGRLGTIQGAKAGEIPADKRFYVGGGGSVRAYGHQLAGPVAEDTPEGGRSSLSFGGEARIRVTERIGVVPFVEAGSVSATPWPDLGQRLLWGPGLGLRYHTPIGPVRLDLAVPMVRREGVDDPVQVYLSLGQAF